MTNFCLICKRKTEQESSFCTEHQRYETRFNAIREINKDFSGISPPAVFIGSRLEYPNVNVGILTPIENTENPENFNNPNYWAANNYDMKRISALRTGLINSRFKADVFQARNQGRLLELSQEIAMSMRPANVEIHLEKKPAIRKAYFEDTSLPIGPSAELKHALLTENVKISSKVQKVVYDTDLKAVDGLRYLNQKGFDENQLQQLLSVGILGVGKNRKLVPTRHSITAIDSNLGEDLILNVKHYEKINDYKLFFGNYFGNYYLVLMFPEIWGYELFETYISSKLFNPNEELDYTTDYEGYKKRTSYAEQCAGGYYANRYSVLNYLENEKKQARVICYRFTTEEYEVPLGVWVVRQGVKKTISNECLVFEDKDKMINKAREIILAKFNYNLNNMLAKTRLLAEMKKQNKLSIYF